ncbi:MAG TPA: hypothetical protein VFK44_07975 [Bacillales bacterium]|nr:hypothetical protein [Bacillales bacterium]
MGQNNRISVRINGQEKFIDREPETRMAAASANEKSFQWVLPDTDETAQPRGSQTEHASVNRPFERKARSSVQQTDWRNVKGQAPGIPRQRRKKKSALKRKQGAAGHSFAKKKMNKKKLPKTQWFSGLSAVAVGILMGWVVLSMFAGHDRQDADKAAVPSTNSQLGGTSDSEKTITNLDLSLSIVQGGVFSSASHGNTAVEALRSNGYAAVLQENNGKFYMYIGVGTSQQEAEKLGRFYKSIGQEVWVKPLKTSVEAEQLNGTVRKQLETAKGLLEQLIPEAVERLSADTTGNQAGSEMSKVNEMLASLEKSGTAEVKPLVNQLQSSVALLENYAESDAKNELWKAEQHLLQAVMKYNALATAEQ